MSFSRKDIKNFIRNFNEASWEEHDTAPKLLSEGDCGCDGDETMISMPASDDEVVMGDPIMPETFAAPTTKRLRYLLTFRTKLSKC
jgi:hypothetical protein